MVFQKSRWSDHNFYRELQCEIHLHSIEKKLILANTENFASILIICIGKGDPIRLKISGNTKLTTIYNM